ncbi:hypothetical protein hrd7_16670 [Leptolinea sp. HRD-7]|nr:hypothetical protein hrd7_16670 [Leptolinea sp. HRD-7]
MSAEKHMDEKSPKMEKVATINENNDEQENFSSFIKRMCAASNWVTRELDDEHAIIEFTLDQTRSQTLFIFIFGDELEFSVPSFAAFDSLDAVPHFISSTLLQVNAKTKIGFWCLEQIGNKIVYSFMHNAKIEAIDEKQFMEIVMTLVQRVDEFESLLMKMSANVDGKPDIVQ